MKEHFAYDRVLKDLFQTDRPSLLEYLTGGVRVKEFLNVEFPKVMEWRADLVALLDDDTIFHSEFQGQNDDEIGYRSGIYCFLIGQKYRRPVKQTVLYVGGPPMRMPSSLDAGSARVSYRLLDIRELDAELLLRSGSPGDLALAMLARGGAGKLEEIGRRAAQLSGKARARVMTQLLLLSGLRGLSGKMKMEMKNMGPLLIDIEENEILRELVQEWAAKGKAEGEHETLAKVLRKQLQGKFGVLPEWAQDKIQIATAPQLEAWLTCVLSADSLTAVFSE